MPTTGSKWTRCSVSTTITNLPTCDCLIVSDRLLVFTDTMAGAGIAGLAVYGVLIPLYVVARLKVGCKAAEQVARGVKGHLMSLQDVTVRSGKQTDSPIVGILPADTIVQVFEKIISPSGKVRARIGEDEWVTEKTYIKRLMCNEPGIYTKNQAFQETYGWLILKYKPDRWWFEM